MDNEPKYLTACQETLHNVFLKPLATASANARHAAEQSQKECADVRACYSELTV